jgi:hypothetical protein
MGKRELLIAATFAVLAAIAYQVTAPPAQDTGRGHSLDTLAENWRNRNTPDRRGHATVTTTGRVSVPPAIAELRLADLTSVHVVGEDRGDIEWTLTVEASGPDNDSARRLGESTTVRHDDLGRVLSMAVRADGEGAAGALHLRVPSSLLLRIESARQTRVSGVAGVRLESLVGDVTLDGIAGAVDGAHRNGHLEINDAGTIELTLAGSDATLRRARGGVSLNARNGSTRIEATTGPTVVEVTGQDLTIADAGGTVRATAVGGAVTIERPGASVDVDARRARVGVLLSSAVTTTIFATEGHVTLAIPSALAVRLDVVSESGTIDASAVNRAAVVTDGDSVLTAGDDRAARVSIRAQRSSIVISPGK